MGIKFSVFLPNIFSDNISWLLNDASTLADNNTKYYTYQQKCIYSKTIVRNIESLNEWHTRGKC